MKIYITFLRWHMFPPEALSLCTIWLQKHCLGADMEEHSQNTVCELMWRKGHSRNTVWKLIWRGTGETLSGG